jgi:putative intracellular protease/amidase
MANVLDGKKVAILATDGFEQVELTEPRKILEDAGATVTVLSVKATQTRSRAGTRRIGAKVQGRWPSLRS